MVRGDTAWIVTRTNQMSANVAAVCQQVMICPWNARGTPQKHGLNARRHTFDLLYSSLRARTVVCGIAGCNINTNHGEGLAKSRSATSCLTIKSNATNARSTTCERVELQADAHGGLDLTLQCVVRHIGCECDAKVICNYHCGTALTWMRQDVTREMTPWMRRGFLLRLSSCAFMLHI